MYLPGEPTARGTAVSDYDEDDEPLLETPFEFMSSLNLVTGVCNGQSIVRGEGGRYFCHCTCGWDRIAPDRDSGLALAREHTADL
jgi:hypothetical protein